jgi:hypothetical protein
MRSPCMSLLCLIAGFAPEHCDRSYDNKEFSALVCSLDFFGVLLQQMVFVLTAAAQSLDAAQARQRSLMDVAKLEGNEMT